MTPLQDIRAPGSFADTLRLDPEAWALRIAARWRASIESIIETGQLLLDAKQALQFGQFEEMIARELPFSASTARRLMTVAEDKRISNRAHAHVLPASWYTIYELTKLSDEEFTRGIDQKIIRPDMERKDVEMIRPIPRRAEPIPEPAESVAPDHDAAGGVLIPSMAAEQSGEQEAGETTEVSASGSSSPALLAPADPSAVEGAEGDDQPHAPPATIMPGGGLAIAHPRVEPTDGLEFFPTPLWATRALVEHVFDRLGRKNHCKFQVAWEPACGEGHMAEPLKEYFREVIASDINDYGYGDHTVDFLTCEQLARRYDADWIITNPPFKDSTEFVLNGLRLAGTGVAMFVRLSWLESIGRYEQIFRDTPPSLVSIFAERVPLHKGRWLPNGGTLTSYAWLTWIKGMEPQPPFWIPPGCRMALTKPQDAARFGKQDDDDVLAAEATE